MRKTHSGPRSSNSGSKRQHSRNGRTQQSGGAGNGNRPRSGGARSRNQASQMWLQASPKTLTSHISMVHKNTNRDNTAKKGEGRNENENGNGRSRFKGKPTQDKNRRPYQKQGGKPRNHPRNDSRNAKGHQSPATNRKRSNETGDDRLVAGIKPFDLFCSYHLGIGRDKQYKPANINEVANRFASDPATIRQALKEYDMDSASLLDRDFDMALAQLDIQVAPEGVDRMELAKNLYMEFLDSPVKKRDWNKILEEDRKENQKVFKN